MCGDGANDAPALRQAQIGIAVSTATDVAKSAAGMVLTEAGLGGIVAAVKEGRITFQRILTYTLNSVIKKIVQVLLLAIGLIMTGHAVLTPMLMVIVMITGDFLAMSLTTDRVPHRLCQTPGTWAGSLARLSCWDCAFLPSAWEYWRSASLKCDWN
jgi:H+-transporting ATPase